VRRAYGIGLGARFAVDLRIAKARDRLWRSGNPRPDARLNVVLLSFARPRNIQPIAERVLRCDFVERLVISNNDPSVRLADDVRVSSSRVTILQQTAPCPPMKRFETARELSGEYFLALDDDVLLRAEQIDALFRALVADRRCRTAWSVRSWTVVPGARASCPIASSSGEPHGSTCSTARTSSPRRIATGSSRCSPRSGGRGSATGTTSC
jgi:hypothetical protein